MKKFLLVLLTGMALTINVYGFVNEYVIDSGIEEINHIAETTTTVYME